MHLISCKENFAMELTTLHETLVFERTVPATVEQVFEAYANLSKRTDWGAPSENTALIYDAADFSEGGQDRFRCGAKANPNIHGVTTYLDIVPNRRIVSTETITVDGKRLCASLTTLELTPQSAGANLKITTQLASFIGEDMIHGHKNGTNASLDNLLRYFSRKG
jgi:uncharacterized protein YndB with AHSA1/START domain